MIGTCGFTRFDYSNNSAEIGYVINPEFRGRGIAGEAARRVIRFGFDELGLNRIEAKYMDGNVASRKVMEKIGMKYEGTMRGSLKIGGSTVTSAFVPCFMRNTAAGAVESLGWLGRFRIKVNRC